MQFGIIQNVWQKLYTYGVSLDAMNTEAYLVLPDLDYGFDNYKQYLHHCQKQNNDMSFTHSCPPVGHGPRGGSNRKVESYSKNK
jgi:hypothetical protein